MAAFVLGGVVACGGGGGSSFGGANGEGAGGGGAPGTTPPLFGNGSDGGGGGSLPACATSSAKAEAAPVFLVFMFDKSGSMDESAKWTSCGTALKAFFSDPGSKGISASLQFFGGDECNVATYSTPLVPMKALPDGATFATKIDSVSPNGNTPTLPALEGALAYAAQVQTQHAEGKAAVVLVTDGLPRGCGTLNQVVQTAQQAAQKIPTYVIGVGDSLTNLNAIAQGGGTGDAVIVSTTDPTKITQKFQEAIDKIKRQALSCEYAIPTPPDGKELDVNAVNVVYTPGNGAATTLSYDKDCAGAGWRYDDPAKPSKVTLCKAACDTVKADEKGALEVQFGCATKGGVTR